jgi:protein SCO1/2
MTMPKNVRRAFFNACCAMLVFAACQKQQSAPPEHPSVPDRQDFFVSGWVKELSPGGKTIVIQHEAISNYMGAMTMPFEVHDTNVLNGIKPGDAITFHLVVTATDGWIASIARRQQPDGAASAPPGMVVTRAVEPLDEGETLPDYHFTNELGAAIDLSQYKGQVFAFTFFFTSCPYPNFCPRMTGNFAAAAAQLAGNPRAPARWHLFSISFDPKTDTAQHLQAYAKNEHYDPACWSFLTGAPEQISELADNFGEDFWAKDGGISHNLRTVVIDPQFRVRKIIPGNTWTSAELVDEMVRAGAK